MSVEMGCALLNPSDGMVCRLLVLYIQTLNEGSSVLRSWHMMYCMNLRQNLMSRLRASTDKKARIMLYRSVFPQCNLAAAMLVCNVSCVRLLRMSIFRLRALLVTFSCKRSSYSTDAVREGFVSKQHKISQVLCAFVYHACLLCRTVMSFSSSSMSHRPERSRGCVEARILLRLQPSHKLAVLMHPSECCLFTDGSIASDWALVTLCCLPCNA